ncbi:MAG: DUF481 domain-containing protein [Pirellulales bacterium]
MPPGFEALPPLQEPVGDVPLEKPLTSKELKEIEDKKAKEEKILLPWYYYRTWSGSFDLGANGSDGNSQSFNLRMGLNAVREVPWSITTHKGEYVNTSSNSQSTADRLFYDGRYEWLFQESPWSVYIHETTLYDEFTAFDVRVTVDAGIGYLFWKNDIGSFKGRLGPGVSREFGGPDDDWIPELVFGALYERKISKYQKFNVSIDYFPRVDDFTAYRVNTQINWEIVLDEVNNLSMKIGVIDRYDSTPEGKKPNNIDYKTVLVWSF